jgi:DNA-directed RNA polymerase subunit F
MEDLASKLGPEFANATAISIPEVVIVLQYLKEQGQISSNNAIFEKIFAYAKRYNRFPEAQISSEVRGLLIESGFTQIEVALLMNLCPQTVAEAKALIPELNRCEDENRLSQILDELARLKNLQ